MKRTFICFFGILVFVLSVSVFDGVFMSSFAENMESVLEEIQNVKSFDEMRDRADKMVDYYKSQEFLLHRLVPTNRLEEIEVSFVKLKAFLEVENYDECLAIAAEIESRVNQLYSTGFRNWYQKIKKCIG